jgi:hypothetical protein
MSVETEATRWSSIHSSSNNDKASAKEPNDSGNTKHRRTNQCEERVEAHIGTTEQAATPTNNAGGNQDFANSMMECKYENRSNRF